MDPYHCGPYNHHQQLQQPRFGYNVRQHSNSSPTGQRFNSQNTNSTGHRPQYGWSINNETNYGPNMFQNQAANRNMGQMPNNHLTRFTRNRQSEPTSLIYRYRGSVCDQQYTNRADSTAQRHLDFSRDRRNEFQVHHQHNLGFSSTRYVTNGPPLYSSGRSAEFSVEHVPPVRNPWRYDSADTFRNEKVFISPRRAYNSELNGMHSPSTFRPKNPIVTGSPIPVVKHHFGRGPNNTDRRSLKYVKSVSICTTNENMKMEMNELNCSKVTSESSNQNNKDRMMLESDNETFSEEPDDSDDKGVDHVDISNDIVSEKVNSESEERSKEAKSELYQGTISDKNTNSDKNTSAEVLMLVTKTEHLCLKNNQTTEISKSEDEASDAENIAIMMADTIDKEACYNDEAFERNTNCKIDAKHETRANYENVPRSDDGFNYTESSLVDNMQNDKSIILEVSASSIIPYTDQISSQMNTGSCQTIKSEYGGEEPARDIVKPVGNVFCKPSATSIAPSECSNGSNHIVTSQNKIQNKPGNCLLQKDQNKAPIFRKQNVISCPQFHCIKTDGDRQLLKQYKIPGSYIDLGSRCDKDTPAMNDATRLDETPGTSYMETVDTKSTIPPERRSPVCFLSYDDSNIDGFDEDEDSDDDELLAPAFLQSIDDIMNRPAPSTPTRALDISVGNSTPSSSQTMPRDCESPDLIPVKLSNKLTLDGLFQEHEEHAEHVKEMDEINKELQDDLKQGGFVHILNREESLPEESLTDEQRNMLRQLEVQDTSLHQDWPGMVLFKPENYQCLFNNTLHPTHCGFTATSNGGRLERYLESLSVDQYKMVITSQMIPQLFMKIANHSQLLRWLFYMMSIHEDDDIQRGSLELLLDILHTQQTEGVPKWTPSLKDVLSVLVNYGASLESLLPCGPGDVDIFRGTLLQQPGYSQQPNVHHVTYSINNLMLVLKVITQSLHGQCGQYSPNDASLLIYALCKVILDPSTKTCPYSMEILQNCITMVIRQYTESDWIKERLRLCRLLANLSTHHHDLSHVAQLLSGGERGTYLQRRYCYLATSQVLTGNCDISDDELDNFEIGYLEKFVNYIRDLLENDPYTLSSIIKLIELTVGINSALSARQREQLKSLQEKVSRVRVKDCIGMLDRTRVKNMIVMVTSKWALDLQTVRRKQTKIFEYASSPVKLHIETLKPVQSSDDEDEESDNEDHIPNKIPKLSDVDDEVNFQTSVTDTVQRTNGDVISMENESCNVQLSNNSAETVSQVIQAASKDEICEGISNGTLSQTDSSEVTSDPGTSQSLDVPVISSSDVT